MPKKDVNAAVLGMLSATGSQTRPPTLVAEVPPEPVSPSAASSGPPPTVGEESPRPVTPLPPARADQADETAPRTLRLRTATAAQLRAAWLEAKRDDVLLTAQDFASNLVEDGLARRRRRAASSS